MSLTAIQFTAATGLALLVYTLITSWFTQHSRRRAAEKACSELEREASQLKQTVDHYSVRFKAVIDADGEALKVSQAANAECDRAKSEVRHLETTIRDLRASYMEKKVHYDALLEVLSIVDEKVGFAELGVYEPTFEFATSEDFKLAINEVAAAQKEMITAKSAVTCAIPWTVDGSQTEGRKMSDRGINLTLRAFNNECEAAIAKIRWNNAHTMQKRIELARDKINKLNATLKITIAPAYFDLKLKELRLTHEYREKVRHEREERREAMARAREELRLREDLLKAEVNEEECLSRIERARANIRRASGGELQNLRQHVQRLEQELAEVRAKRERAQAMAELTSCGYVYIISNVGSFGPDVVKIGLTRRLDPMDRVRELGDASVPFVFDTHAIIFSEAAPALEAALHSEFAARRVNDQNHRKEFFKVSLTEVEEAIERLAPTAPFFRDVEAQDYRETLSRRQSLLERRSAVESVELPACL